MSVRIRGICIKTCSGMYVPDTVVHAYVGRLAERVRDFRSAVHAAVGLDYSIAQQHGQSDRRPAVSGGK
ncbi:MAG: hypothetical protein II396_00395 [Methanobrevibacter sp.]|nr:hypothetical protein [Methanobrevibacter sp.]